MSIEYAIDYDADGQLTVYRGETRNQESVLYKIEKGTVIGEDSCYVRTYPDKRIAYTAVADPSYPGSYRIYEGDDYTFAASYDIFKSDSQIWNENKHRFEPLLFALVTDMEYTEESADVTTVTVPRLINANRVQKAWIESNNGGSQFEKVIKKKVRAQTVPFYQGANKESRVVTNAPFVNQQIIMPFGWESRYPKLYAHLSGFLRKFDANAHDDDADGLTGIYEKELADGNAKPYGVASRGVRVH